MQETTKGITPSQTVGPYFAYGLTPTGKYDVERRFHQQPRHAGYVGRTHPHRRPGVRRRRRGRAGWHAGDLAGGRAGPLRRSRRTSARCRIRRSRASAAAAPTPNGGYAFDTIKPGRSARIPTASRRRRTSARGLCARHAAASLHADLFRRRGGQCRRSRAGAGAGRPPRHADRKRASRARATRSIASTSTCRATTRRCSSRCEFASRCLSHSSCPGLSRAFAFLDRDSSKIRLTCGLSYIRNMLYNSFAIFRCKTSTPPFPHLPIRPDGRFSLVSRSAKRPSWNWSNRSN